MAILTLVLLVVGLALLVAEAHLPTFGVVGAAGVAALVAGVVLATIGAGGSVALAVAIAVPLAAGAGAVGAIAVAKARAAARKQVRCGAEGLVGRVGVVRRALDPQGQIQVDGELWRARRSWAEEDEPPPQQGDAVVVDHVNGLTLSVRRAEVWEVER